MVHRIDRVTEGEQLGRVSPLFHIEPKDKKMKISGPVQPTTGTKLLQGRRMVALGANPTWDGKIFAGADNGHIFSMDTSVPLECKNTELMESEEFQELGELQDLGEVKTKNDKMYLYDYVARSKLNITKDNGQHVWTVVNYFADGSGMCGVSTVARNGPELVVPYH